MVAKESFGLLLPVLTFSEPEEIKNHISHSPQPLALYLFTADKNLEKKIISEISFGGGCVNDVFIHLANPNLPFGGVGDSGSGQYHGKYGFETFTHRKSVTKSRVFPG